MSRRVLVVAGHDPTHGAGVEADRATLARFGLEAVCVVSAWTEQDGERVQRVEPRAVEEWLAEARHALQTPVLALKTGLLPSAAAVRAVTALARALAPLPLVVDPVLAATGGEPFLDGAGVDALRAELCAAGVILTPNLPEAARLSGHDLAALQREPAARLAAAEALLALGCRAIVLKGGHAADAEARDLLLERSSPPRWFPRPRLAGARLHGSGCRFASALAAHLALGQALPAATQAAGDHLAALLAGLRPA